MAFMFLCRLLIVLMLVALLSLGVLSLELLQRMVNWIQESANLFQIIQRFVIWYNDYGDEVIENGMLAGQAVEPEDDTIPIQEEGQENEMRGGEIVVVPGQIVTMLRNTRHLVWNYQAHIEHQKDQMENNQTHIEHQEEQMENNQTYMERQKNQMEDNKLTIEQQKKQVEQNKMMITSQLLDMERQREEEILLQKRLNKLETIIAEREREIQKNSDSSSSLGLVPSKHELHQDTALPFNKPLPTNHGSWLLSKFAIDCTKDCNKY